MVVGLGNPGSEYEQSLHNIGCEVLDLVGKELNIDVKKKKFGACFGSGEFEGKKLILLKPWLYMNRSGQAVATAAGFYKLALSDVLVISDDMALEPGRIRLRAKGTAGGHNGLADIIEKLGSNEFGRLRIGIGQDSRIDAYDYVLGKFTEEQKPLMAEGKVKAKKAVLCWLENGIDAAMNEFNPAESG